MAKNKKVRQPTKKRAQKKKRSAMTVSSVKPSNHSSFVRQICAVTNPFCREAVGARWPDNSMIRSIGWSVVAQPMQAPADSNGSMGVAFRGNIASFSVSGPLLGGNTCTFTSWTKPVSEPSGVSSARLTSWGIRISSPLSKMTATGMLRVRLYSLKDSVPLESVDGNTSFADATLDIPISRLIDRDLYITPKSLGEVARLYDSQILTTTTDADAKWSHIVCFVAGAPASSTPLNFVMFYHYEFLVDDGVAAQAFARAPPKDNPLIRNGNANVIRDVPNFLESVAERVDSLFQSKAVRFIAGALGGYYGGSKGAAIGYTGMKMIQNGDAMEVD